VQGENERTWNIYDRRQRDGRTTEKEDNGDKQRHRKNEDEKRNISRENGKGDDLVVPTVTVITLIHARWSIRRLLTVPITVSTTTSQIGLIRKNKDFSQAVVNAADGCFAQVGAA